MAFVRVCVFVYGKKCELSAILCQENITAEYRVNFIKLHENSPGDIYQHYTLGNWPKSKILNHWC